MRWSDASGRIRALAALSATTVVVVTTATLGHGMIPQYVPVDRLIANLGAYIKEHPDDPEAHYRLGRVHMLALETRARSVLAFDAEPPRAANPAEGSWATPRWRTEKPADASPEQLRTHASEAIRLLNTAIRMRPTEGRYRLTLACALEAGKDMLSELDVWPLLPDAAVLQPTLESAYWIEEARARFAAIPKDRAIIADWTNSRREEYWWGRARDVVMRLAYEHRARPEYQAAVAELRAADWRAQIEHQYFTAMCYALPVNGHATEKPIWGDMTDWVSYEAAQDFIRVVGSRQARPDDAIRLRVAKETIAAFDHLPQPNAITPIIIDFAGGRSLDDLESSLPSTFPLDGTTRPQRWSWVKPDVGLLAWDPAGSGCIESGRQLFGAVTWWVFFADGYQALDALDDDRDGNLTGAELAGLAVWFDRNQNGVSDPGEIEPVAARGIASISCRPTHREGDALSNRSGVQLSAGRAIPTFDWIAKAVALGDSAGDQPD